MALGAATRAVHMGLSTNLRNRFWMASAHSS